MREPFTAGPSRVNIHPHRTEAMKSKAISPVTSQRPSELTKPVIGPISLRALATPEPLVRLFARRVEQEGALDLTQGDYKNADFAPHRRGRAGRAANHTQHRAQLRPRHRAPLNACGGGGRTREFAKR